MHIHADPPTDMGHSALEWLKANGYPATTPTIRSSDYELCLSNPFAYFLRRRLSLVNLLENTECLTRGSWFHTAAQIDPLEGDLNISAHISQYRDILTAREAEITTLCRQAQRTPTQILHAIENERRVANEALALYHAAATVPTPLFDGGRFPIRHYLLSKNRRVLGREIRIEVPHPSGQRGFPPLVAQLDALVLNVKSNLLFIIDWKTTQHSLLQRLSWCPLEFQPEHYLHILDTALADPRFRRKYELPQDVAVGGMVHLGVRVPNLRFGKTDRDYRTVEKELKSGPGRGTVRTSRVYFGEPKITNYLSRIRDKLAATGEYAEEAKEREADPWANYSTTRWATIDSDRYVSRLSYITDHAMREPLPRNFLQSSRVSNRNETSDVGIISLAEPKEWPAIFRRLGLTQQPRDAQDTPHDE